MMAQNEEMKRLLYEGEIVGYEWHKHGLIYHSKMLFFNFDMPRINIFYIEHDHFDFGIKVDGDWWFEGDINETNEILCFGEFSHKHRYQIIKCHGWYWKWMTTDGVCQFYHTSNYAKIGNIYDKMSIGFV